MRTPNLRTSLMLIASAVAVSLSSCTPYGAPNAGATAYLNGWGPGQGNARMQNQAIPDDVSYWEGDNVQGKGMIKINRAQQKAFFYKNNQLVGVSKISSGDEDHGTPPGKYKIQQKNRDHKSSIYGVFKDKATGQTINDNVDIRVDKIPAGAVFYNAPMPNFMRFNYGIGMHTGFLPGYPASHGCVRMPDYMARKFFDNINVGDPVIVE